MLELFEVASFLEELVLLVAVVWLWLTLLDGVVDGELVSLVARQPVASKQRESKVMDFSLGFIE